jgi:EAL domain-containing protein (putative c-di-GMP-specific phosphodiesterase class I)
VILAHDFIALSERLGLIRLVDQRALELALETLAAAPAARLSLNVSAETVENGEWIARLSEAISARPDLVGRLIIEITETAVIRNVDEAAHFVAMLHGLGCKVAIDDFGAGFSSFRHLRQLGVDMVKIDGAFVERLPHNRDDQVFVRALIELARNFRIATVAEWVQDEPTAAMLAEWGVDYIQGNLLGEAVTEWPLVETSARSAGEAGSVDAERPLR